MHRVASCNNANQGGITDSREGTMDGSLSPDSPFRHDPRIAELNKEPSSSKEVATREYVCT